MKKTSFLLLAAFQFCHGRAQDAHFSQPYETPMLRNPALAGNFNGQSRFQTVYRTQWSGVRDQPSFPRPYVTMGLAGEYKITGYCMDDDKTANLNLQIVHDFAGDSRLTRTAYLFGFTYKMLTFENSHFAGGFYGGGTTSNFSNAGLRWDDQYVNGQYSPNNPTRQPFPITEKDYLDCGAGFVVSGTPSSYKRWYVGSSVYHLTQPAVGFDGTSNGQNKLPRRWTVNAGLAITVNDNLDNLRLYGDVMLQAGQGQVVFGGLYKLNLAHYIDVPEDDVLSITGGLLVRIKDAVIPVINLNWNKFAVGFSYDFTSSRLTENTRPYGAFEFTLKFRGTLRDKNFNCEKSGCDEL